MSQDDAFDRCKRVYEGEAGAYDRLISAEDCDGNLLPAIESVASVHDAALVDVGAGTGRLARLLAPLAASVTASDGALAMIRVAREHVPNARVAQADARRLPYPDDAFDVATAGWVFGHLTFWDAADWESQIDRALSEMNRVVKPGGRLIVFETMGTAVETPGAPEPQLQAYYEWLVSERGFAQQVLSTDYGFASVDAAAEACGFFFGPEFEARIRSHEWARVPEWTGMWSRSAD